MDDLELLVLGIRILYLYKVTIQSTKQKIVKINYKNR